MTELPVVMPIARVAVLADTKMVDVALPTELPLREIIPAVRRLTGDVEPGTPAALSLAPIGGPPFSLDATLDTVGVVDGDLLMLQPVPAGPPAPGIVEDVADAAVLFSSARSRPWTIDHIRRGARLAILGLILAVTGLAVAYHVAVGGVVPLAAAAALAAGTALAALLAAKRSPRLSTELAVVALAPIAAAFALAAAGDGAAQVLLAAAGLTAWSLVCLILGTPAVAWFTGVTVMGLGLAMAAALAIAEVSLRSIGCALIVAALVTTVRAPQLAATCARFPVPTIPAPGDPTPSAPPMRVLADLPRRVRAADAYQTGILAAAVLLAVTGSVAVVADTPTPWGWYLVLGTAAAAVLHARVWDSVPCKAWLLAHPFLLGVALTTLFAVTDRYTAAMWSLLAVAGLTTVWVVVATNPRIASADTYSLPARRAVGFLAAGIDASLLPVVAYLVGLFEWVLNR